MAFHCTNLQILFDPVQTRHKDHLIGYLGETGKSNYPVHSTGNKDVKKKKKI